MQQELEVIGQTLKDEQITCNVRKLKNEEKACVNSVKIKLIFFVKEGLDTFLEDIIKELSNEYETKKIIVAEYKQIEDGMKWADICWFEWCDELIIYGSKLELAKEKKIICRLHSYEAFTNYIYNVNFDSIDKIIFVAEHIKNNVLEKINIYFDKVSVIYNGIDLKRFRFKERKKGFNIAYVGYINFKKGPMLLLHAFKAIFDKDSRYKLYIAGRFQEERYVLYFKQMITEMGLQNNVIYEDWQEDINKWLEDKNYILCTSVLEGNPLGVMEGMARGIKPLIHNFVGAKLQFGKYTWNTIDEVINMINAEEYNSREYRNFIEENYSLKKQITLIKNVINEVRNKKNIIEIVENLIKDKKYYAQNLPNCTLLITLFNRAKILSEDLKNGFKLGSQHKLIIDDCSSREIEEMDSIVRNKDVLGIEKVIVHERNKGLAGSRHTGYKNIKTLNTIVLDDDDMLLCIDKSKIKEEYNRLKQDAVIVIPRYIVNLYEDKKLNIGYDRKCYDKLKAKDVLRDISITSEIKALLAGSISNTNELLKYSTNEFFVVAEDIMTLIGMFANNLDKMVIVSESYVHVRRINKNTLSKTISEKKLALGMIAQCVGCYYCVKNNIFKINDAFNYMRKRGNLLEQLYKYGESFVEEIISYLNNHIKEQLLVKYLNSLGIEVRSSIDEICLEINLMRKLVMNDTNNNNDHIKLQENLPKVSIIIPTFNRKEFLEESLYSAIKQDYPNIEIIVCDNCSTDGTDDIMKKYNGSPKVKYIKNNENLGGLRNMKNALYNYACGDYCLILNDDDYLIDTNYISKAIKLFIGNENLLLVFANCKLLDQDTGELRYTNYNIPQINLGIEYFLNYEIDKYVHITGFVTAIFERKSAMISKALEDESTATDTLLYLKLMLIGNVGFIREYAGVYRIHQGNSNWNNRVKGDALVIQELENLKQNAKEKYNINEDIMNQWINFRIFKYLFWRINSSNEKQLEELKAFFNESKLSDKYPIAYNQLLKFTTK